MTTRGDVNGAIRGFIDDTYVRPVRCDASTWGLLTIDQSHHEIHEGDHFFYSDFVTALTTAVYRDFGILTSDTTKWTHMTFDAQTPNGIIITSYEGPTVTWNGSNITCFNNNRNSSNTCDFQYFQSNPTVSASIATGTKIFAYTSGDGGNITQTQPGNISRENELILKQNTAYVWRIYALSTTAVSWRANFYQHVYKGYSSES